MPQSCSNYSKNEINTMSLRFLKQIMLISILILQSIMTNSQGRKIDGRVTIAEKYGINKASIIVGSTKAETFSDTSGYYSITCNDDDKITFSANGFYSEKINLRKIQKSDSLNVDLKLKKGDKNFAYATGYGHIDEERLSYAIKHFESQTDYSGYKSILEIIEGRTTGVTIRRNTIEIRGTSTLNGNTPALLVVDGTTVEFSTFSNIPPSQIKTIDVLKGAAASARYGSRGMGGVIVVVTKSKN